MDQKWLDISPSGWQDIAVGLMRERQYELAMEKLEYMEKEDMKVDDWVYDALTYMLCEHEEFDYALKIMQQRLMKNLGQGISRNLWMYFLDHASQSLHVRHTYSVSWLEQTDRIQICSTRPPPLFGNNASKPTI